MFRMEVDSSPESASVSHYDLIVQRLSQLGFPEDSLSEGPSGLVAFAKNNKSRLRELVYAILPTDNDEVDEVIFRVSMVWLQWLMFEGEPEAALDYLSKVSADQRGVCGAVWGSNDIAYRCRTCEHDPTCAICVPCFENGKHEGHDYSIIYTGGGCCDCGDITAWKREGFCSNHKGAEQIPPLPERVAMSLGPVMDLLLSYWKDKLVEKNVSMGSPVVPDNDAEPQKAADELTSSVVEMLLDFCKYSESLLSFISGRVYSSSGLLEILLRGERFLNENVVVKLHELLLKLLGEPIFKYEFAKAFVVYYGSIISTAVSKSSDTEFRKYPLISTFSVQIWTVPTLTLRLVEEVDLLGMLMQSLGSIFRSCSGDDGRLQVAKWVNLYETTQRVVEDMKFVMGHSSVAKYLCLERRELVRTWMGLMASVQGMNAQKRETSSHIEEENENVHLPFMLCYSMFNILSPLVAGAFSSSSNKDVKEEMFSGSYKIECEDRDGLRHAKVGRLSEESTISSVAGKNSLNCETRSYADLIPSSALWLTYESLKSMENWLEIDNTTGPLSGSHPVASNSPGNNLLAPKRTHSKFKRVRYKPSIASEALNKHYPSPSHGGSYVGVGLELSQFISQEGSHDENLLEAESTSESEALRVLSVSEWPDISYDVSSQLISVHIPLHRVLSMVLLRALKECHESGSSNQPTFSANSSVGIAGDFLGQILEGCHPNGFAAYVMEHPLRIRVFCAQVHAGMWRRNGDAPILFSEWYRSVRWSEQSQDLDLFLLQCCAALAPPDLYVHRILERFGLSNYLSLNFEQHSEHEPTLVAEMLTLLVQIVKERRFCGMTSAECLHRELVYKLSIGDATRSQLVKSLPRDLSKMSQLQEVLDTVAEYSQPSGMTQGMYKLRSSYWKELDLYHPRWNSRDQQAAEERYLRFCNVSALTAQLPKWSKVYYPLRGIAKVATCKAILQIIRSVLFYAAFMDKHTASRAPDDVLLTALHLLALALDVCQVHKKSGDPSCYVGDVIPLLAFATEEIGTSRYGGQSMLSLLVLLMKMHEKESSENFVEAGNFSLSSLILKLIKTLMELEPGFLTKLQKLEPQLANQFSHSILISNAKDTASVSESEKRKAKARERQAAVLEKMRAQQSKFMESFHSKEDEEMDDTTSEEELYETPGDLTESPEVICSLCHDAKSRNPVAFLALLQKSRLLSFVGREPPTWKEAGSSVKEPASVSTTRKDKASINYDGGSEVVASSQLEESILSAINDFARIGQPNEVHALIETVKSRFPSVKNNGLPSLPRDARERTTLSSDTWEENVYLSIRGSSSNDESSSAAGTSARISTSESLLVGKYIAMLPKETPDHPSASQDSRMQLKNTIEHHGYGDFGPSGGDGIYVSSCGHAVHQGCLDRYLQSLRDRNQRRINFEGGQVADPDLGEFLCPVCRGLANSVLPALPGDSRKVPQSLSWSADASIPMHLTEAEFTRRVQDGLSFLHRAADIAGSTENLNVIPTHNVKQPNIELTIRLLRGMYYPGQDKILKTGRVSDSVILWDTLKYSLISTEIAARSTKSSMNPNYSLAALYKELKSSSGFILSVLLNVTQSTRTANPASVLLRVRGLQLFARSLCHDISPETFSNYPAGGMLYILENADEVQYPDSRLWRRASGPVLAYDPFSSLMWVLFCLPRPVLSCQESLLSLVHIFYLVTIIQAISALYKRRNEPNLVARDSLITDIYRVMRECGEAVPVQCFDSDSVDLAYDFNDTIRSLTFPYLRRCALLWKLINCSNSMPFGGISGNGLESGLSSTEELPEIAKLEKMFKIPSLSIIFNDEESRSTAMRWLSHFQVASGKNKMRISRCAPALPFKLIRLPRVYQDLLQRYIKKSCPRCGSAKEEPALCLLCGELCSPSWKHCCRESCCQSHASECGAGIGVFLLIRKTTILLQRSARQAPWPSPFLDSFGEEDNEMHRGKPLFLNEERYAALTHMVASHGLDRSSKVLRQTTLGTFFVF